MAQTVPEGIDLASIPDPVPGTKLVIHPNFSDEPKSCVPGDGPPSDWTKETFAAGEKSMQFWSSRIHGLVASKKKIAELWAFHLSNVFGTKKHRRGSTYFYESASIKFY